MDKTASYINVTDTDFAQVVLQSDEPVLVDFWATWCPPCVALAPTIEELAAEFQGRVKVVKVDVDQAQATAAQFGIQSIPTIAFFRGGKEVDRVVGLEPKQALASKMEQLLKPS